MKGRIISRWEDGVVGREKYTDFGVSFHFHDFCALDDGGAGVVDAIKHRLKTS